MLIIYLSNVDGDRRVCIVGTCNTTTILHPLLNLHFAHYHTNHRYPNNNLKKIYIAWHNIIYGYCDQIMASLASSVCCQSPRYAHWCFRIVQNLWYWFDYGKTFYPSCLVIIQFVFSISACMNKINVVVRPFTQNETVEYEPTHM